MEDPYDILCISRTASFAEVRQRYIELAKLHHPDKLHHISEEEKKEHEKYFKKVTGAYQRISDIHNGKANKNSYYTNINDNNENSDEWRNIWNSVENFLKEQMKTMFEKTPEKQIHIFRLPVTLEDIYNKKIKKVELILRNQNTPIYLRVNCNEYPEALIQNNGKMYRCKMILQEHKLFTIDNCMNLCYKCEITMKEYINGSNKIIKYLDLSDIIIDIEPFSKLEEIIIHNKGLLENTSLIIKINLSLPSKELWDKLDNHEKMDMQNSLNQINALFKTSDGL